MSRFNHPFDSKFKKFYKARARGVNSYYVDMDRKYTQTAPVTKFNREVWNNGVNWFNEGFELEEADERLRNNTNFVNGYNHAKRLKAINDELETFGIEGFEKGELLENAPENYVNNPHFVKGYNDAKNNVKRKGL